jgi:hypothetical protein
MFRHVDMKTCEVLKKTGLKGLNKKIFGSPIPTKPSYKKVSGSAVSEALIVLKK